MRVAGGLGTVPRIVAKTWKSIARNLPVQEGSTASSDLQALSCGAAPADRPHACAVRAGVLIDCHSMPGNIRSPAAHPAGFHHRRSLRHQRFGRIVARGGRLLEEMGFAAIRNKPYAGGFITEHYGRPARGLHALQIEINRAIYVDEATLEKKPRFSAGREAITAFIGRWPTMWPSSPAIRALAAE
jgi:N-formylglutamate deformylase